MVTPNPMISRKHPALLRVVFALCALLWISPLMAESFVASVDRTQISLGETVELTLRSDKQQFFTTPDLSPLMEHFEILGQRQSSQFTITNGKSVSWTDWIIELRPKRSGFVVIPPIVLEGLATDPITLEVGAAGAQTQTPRTDSAAPVFIEGELDREEAYVQQEIIYNLRIYHSVPLFDDSQLSELKIEDAIVQQLGEPNARSEVINGTRHGVFELRYAIYPQRSGELVIPSQIFTATAANNQGRFDPFLGGRPGKRLAIRSAEIRIEIKAAPAGSEGKPWLPARELTLEQQWSGDPKAMKVGDAITRTLVMRADGLTFAQLPPLQADEVAGLKAYPDQSQTENHRSEQGVLGEVRFASAYVATEPGTYRLPARSIQWFDTERGQFSQATLPEETLTVLPTARLSPTPPTPQPQPLLPPPTTEATTGPLAPSNEADRTDLPWPWISALLAMLWIATLIWGLQRRKPLPVSAASRPPLTSGEESAFQSLVAAIEQEVDGPTLLQHLRQWLGQLLQQPADRSLASLNQELSDTELNAFIQQQERSLYSPQQQPSPTPATLLGIIHRLRRQHLDTGSAPQLKALYG
ncbi:BatD family protein [Aestuariirhabdus litorea]|uniref:Protein BatD n=1 Tax=Aestuariirhabdus litorea TaxID=2528527 RepID=A0A3P3VT44_9GAMM|nr:BatD family protein [Aestuariirhabdus litorea]RRJ84856.1 protein BatD [Aestuariirhabdus litorea]RWW98083.1 protein BatD [Endozoicomonadaceae bacterium GTF-13]